MDAAENNTDLHANEPMPALPPLDYSAARRRLFAVLVASIVIPCTFFLLYGYYTYNRTLAGDRYSPLDEITTANVGQLAVHCIYTLPEVVAFQTGPLVIDGTMYFTSYEGSYAIDAATCKERWSRHDRSSGPPGLAVNRGFAYLDGHLFRGTADAHVVALDAANGHVLRVVGDHGASGQRIADFAAGRSARMIIIGSPADGASAGLFDASLTSQLIRHARSEVHIVPLPAARPLEGAEPRPS